MKVAVLLVAMLGSSALAAPFDEYRYKSNIFRLKKSPTPVPYLDGGPNSAPYMGPQGTFREEPTDAEERAGWPYYNGGYIPYTDGGPKSAKNMEGILREQSVGIPEQAGRSYYGGAGLGVGAGGYGIGAGGYGIGTGGLGVGGVGGYGLGPGGLGVGGVGGLGVYSQFPGAGVGGYGIPLLMSCSPHIVPGHLVRGGYGHGAYKSSEDDSNLEPKEDMLERNFQT